MDMKRLALLVCAVVLFHPLTGCSNRTDEQDQAVLEFSLEDTVMVERETEIDIPLHGILGIPETDHAPVIFILHGTHPVNDAKEDAYYSGFSYLAKSLAKAGFFHRGHQCKFTLYDEAHRGRPAVSA